MTRGQRSASTTITSREQLASRALTQPLPAYRERGRTCKGGRVGVVFLSVVFVLFLSVSNTRAAAPKVRSVWGTEALWGYWEFDSDYILKKDWKIVSESVESPEKWPAKSVIDDNPETFYYPRGKESYTLVIDLGKVCDVGALSILTLGRPNIAVDSRMAKYEFSVGATKDAAGEPVAKGEFDAAEGSETVVPFAATKGRFVTLKVFARANKEMEVCLRKINLISPEVFARHKAAKETAAAAEKLAWEKRDSAAVVEAMGKDFLDVIFCTGEDINKANLHGRPKLEAVGKLKTAGKYSEALGAFKDYYFEKLRRPQMFGLPANDLHPYGRGVAGISEVPGSAMNKDLNAEGLKKTIVAADDLLKGKMTLGNGTLVEIGEPGAVDWESPAPPYGHTTKTRQSYPYRELWWGEAFTPLFTAYVTTKDEKYLKRWVGYMDDWAMNCNFLTEVHPVVGHDNCMYPVVTTIRMFAAIANALPAESDAVPAPAFARILKKLALDSPLNNVVYYRSNPNAWTPGAGAMLLAMLIDEFKAAPVYFRDGRRRNIEDIMTLQELPDGTETHQWPGYNFVMLVNAAALRLTESRDVLSNWDLPVWEKDTHTALWQRELTEGLERRARYTLRWGTPNGQYPLVTHQEPPTEKMYKLKEALGRVPTMLDDPTAAKIYSTMYGDGSVGTPEYTADWFPYGGYSIARTGWRKDDGYGSMFCSPFAGCGGVGSGSKNNIFGLAAYGMDLISDDLVHAYVRNHSPIMVDGKRQQFDFYVPKTAWPTGHRGDLIQSWSDPSPWRWHASNNFNLMEGIYAGVYANDFHKRDEFLDDVQHQRLVLFARKAGLWILTDRMLTAKKHEYEQLWWIPLKRGKGDNAAFAPEEITLDAEAKTVKTARTKSDKWWSWDQLRDVVVGNVNLSMYQFTDAPVKYVSKTDKNGGEMYDRQKISVTWAGEGNQQIVTALFPRKPTPEKATPDGTENDLASIKQLPGTNGTTAFDAVTPDGVRVTYLASTSRAGLLQNEGIEIDGESLLIVRGKSGEDVTGLALGCKSMKIKGAAVAVTGSDFEFSVPASLEAGKVQTVAIYRPISPVQILPGSDVFVDDVDVALKCPTAGVVMTYTVDGTEPTPQSTAYKGPFKLDRSGVVKARAYRPGVVSNPLQTSGTQATATASAVFTKKLASKPEDVKPQYQGLNFEYYEGYWKDLWLALDKQTPVKKGSVDDLFDLSVIPAENPSLNDKLAPRQKTYAFKYTGYLKVPEDGVYTLHAPHEYVHCDVVAGYELQCYVGHALNPDAERTKRAEEMNYWYPATRAHGLGTWSVPLKKGFHEFKIVYIDYRMDGPKRLNLIEGIRDCAWSGEKPDLQISGPGMEKPQAIPAAWLWR